MTIKRAKAYIIGFFVVIVIGGLVAMRWLPAKGVRRQMEAIRAAGLPSSAEELNAWYKAVPVKKNRALFLVEASKEMVPPPADLEKKSDESDTPAYQALLAAHLEKNKAVIEKLHQASELPGSRFPVDLSAGFATLLPHLAPVKSLANLLKQDAGYQARAGNAEGAYRSLASGFAVASAVRQEPIYISELVALACSAITLNAMERVLNETQLTEAQLTSLSTIVAQDEAEGMDGLFRGLVGERAIGITTFDSSFQQFEALGGGNGSTGGAGDWLKVLAYQAYSATGLRQRDLDCYLEMMSLFLDSTRTGFPEALRRADEAQKTMENRFATGLGRLAIFSRMLLPSLEKGTKKVAFHAAQLRCAEIALAIERFRLQHDGALPQNLEELSPKYLHKVPSDPFDNKALVYERLPSKGYRVISAAATADRKRESKNAKDWGMTVSR